MVKQLTVLSQSHGQLIKIGGNQLIFTAINNGLGENGETKLLGQIDIIEVPRCCFLAELR